ncbi:MAG TPA: hypothetical protein VFU49_14670 [Ktedonobacteraceae bacterium]|nr:hypothetical protein [Ktedonobacteraceae bacterium]
MALADYWQLYQQHRADLLGERRGGFVADHPLPVATTWSLSFQRIAAQSPAAAALLKLLAWLPADAIAEEILTEPHFWAQSLPQSPETRCCSTRPSKRYGPPP